jgi:hypothetical protein
MSITTSTVNDVSVISQLNDGIQGPSYKYFTVDNNLLDGTYHPIDTSVDQVGYMSSQVSGTDGTLPTSEYIKYTFDTAVSMQQLRLVGDTLSNIYPTTFTVTYTTSAGSVTLTITDNTSVIWTTTLDSMVSVLTVEFDITAINVVGKSNRILAMDVACNIASTDTFALIITESKAITNNLICTEILLMQVYEGYNRITNGNFAIDSNSDGLADGFKVGGGTAISCTNNTQTFIVTIRYGNLNYMGTLYSGHKYFVTANVKASTTNVYVRCNAGGTLLISSSHPGDGNYHVLYVTMLTVADVTNLPCTIMDFNSSGWSNISVKNFMAIDMGTDSSNPLYNYTAAQMLTRYATYCGQSALTNHLARTDTTLVRSAVISAMTNRLVRTSVLAPQLYAIKVVSLSNSSSTFATGTSDSDATPIALVDNSIIQLSMTATAAVTNPTWTSAGKNLFYPTAGSSTANGVTCTVNADQSITLNGTATIINANILAVNCSKYRLIAGKTYTWSLTEISGTAASVIIYLVGGGSWDLTPTKKKTTVTVSTTVDRTSFGIWVTSPYAVFNNYTFKLQLEQSVAATTWEKALTSTFAVTATLAAGDTLTYDGTAAYKNGTTVTSAGSLLAYTGGQISAGGTYGDVNYTYDAENFSVLKIIANLFRTDLLPIHKNLETQEEFLFDKTDTVPILLSEVSVLTNVYSLMRAATRQIYAKAVIIFSDPSLSTTDVSITASESNRISDLDQVYDGVTEQGYKWFSLANNKLDGTYHLIDTSNYSIGWWSEQASASDGTFATPLIITMTFTSRAISTLQLIGDDKVVNYPVSFVYTLYDNSSNLLYTETVTDNATVSWTKKITTVQAVAKIVLTITKINVGNDVAKIVEIYPVIQETFMGSALYSAHILEEKYPDLGSVQLGTISANELDLVLDNSTHIFSSWNTQTALPNYLLHNRKVYFYLGVTIGSEVEWYPQGIFWTTDWTVSDDSSSVNMTALDILNKLDQSDFYNTSVYENYTLYQLCLLILQDAGLDSSEYNISTTLKDTVIPFAWFSKQSHREALKQISGCALLNIYCDKYGVIQVMPATVESEITTSFDDSTNIFTKSYPLRWSQVANYIEVTATGYAWSTSGSVLDITDAITVIAGQEIAYDYAFSYPSKDVVVTITADSAITYVTEIYGWGITVTYTNSSSAIATVTSVTATGIPLEETSSVTSIAKDTTLIQTNGKMKATVSHNFIQTANYATSLATQMLALYKQSTYDVEVDSRGDIALRIGDQIEVTDRHGTVDSYRVYRQTLDWAGSLSATTIASELTS